MTIVLEIRNEKPYLGPYHKIIKNVIEVKEKNEIIIAKVKGQKGFWELNKNEIERIVM